MTRSPFRPLLSESDCKSDVLRSIAQQLRERQEFRPSEAVPEHLQELVRRLAVAERRAGNN